VFTRFLDITRKISNSTEVWPGDPAVQIEKAVSSSSDAPSVSRVAFGTHTGTHIDFPRHMHLDLAPPALDQLVGECHVCKSSALHKLLDEGTLKGSRVLIKGSALTLEDAESLVKAGIRLVGVEEPSIDEGSSLLVHRLLLGSGVAVIEGFLLEGVEEGPCFLIALPLSTTAEDGAPIRAVLAY